MICKAVVLIVVGATIAHSQAQWHPDPLFPSVQITISKVTSFSCAIVSILMCVTPRDHPLHWDGALVWSE